eukprot:1190396-Amphidinium_carterae.1
MADSFLQVSSLHSHSPARQTILMFPGTMQSKCLMQSNPSRLGSSVVGIYTQMFCNVKAYAKAPFTGNYAAQSGRECCVSSVSPDVLDKEAKELAAYNEFMEVKSAEVKEMEESYAKKQGGR